MKLSLGKIQMSTTLLMRRFGYGLHQGREISYERRISHQPFPRLHAYVEETKKGVSINLHLDQKAPTYGGVKMHAGEYDGAVVERELARIKKLVALYE
ncbi:MAG: hypothetical protein HW383_367 [Candidatus Magasanikbacteria bacterium]|nr:hypothetical protein [Candidatus Magasanikbacteria bacterium]